MYQGQEIDQSKHYRVFIMIAKLADGTTRKAVLDNRNAGWKHTLNSATSACLAGLLNAGIDPETYTMYAMD
jgi:tryptophanyl-tRNA synthetase